MAEASGATTGPGSEAFALKGRVALVTGGASGIGAASAALLGAAGARVAVCDIREDAAHRVAGEIGPAAIALPLDVASEDGWRAAIAEAEKSFGRVDVVVNCAGVSVPAPIDEETLEGWRRTMAINAEGVFLGCKHGVDALRRAGGGSIVNVSSALAVRAGSKYPAYCASKGAVLALTRSVALRCAEQGWNIRCNAICPGVVETPILDRYLARSETREAGIAAFAAKHPLGRIGRPEEIGLAVVFLASDASGFITGAELPVDGGYCA